MHSSLRPHLNDRQLAEYTTFTDERALASLALGIEGVPNFEHFVNLFSKAVNELAVELATVARRGGTRVANIYHDTLPRIYSAADFNYRRANYTSTSLTWNFHVPALSLNAYAHGNTKDGYWASVEPGVAKSSKTEELLAAPRCLSCKSATNGPPAYPLGAQPFMQNGYSFTTEMHFPESERTLPSESLRLSQRQGGKAENLDAPKRFVIYDAYHTYTVKVGQQDHTRQYTNYMVIAFVLRYGEEARRGVPDEFFAIRRTEAAPSSLTHHQTDL